MLRKYLFFSPYQIGTPAFLAGAALGRALVSEGHQVHWLHGQRVLPGGHQPGPGCTSATSDAGRVGASCPICNESTQRAMLLQRLGLPAPSLADWLTEEDRQAAARLRGMSGPQLLSVCHHGDAAIGLPVLLGDGLPKRPQSGAPPAHGAGTEADLGGSPFLAQLRLTLEAAALAARGVGKLLKQQPMDAVVLHRGDGLVDRAAAHRAREVGLQCFFFDTGLRTGTLMLQSGGPTTDGALLQDRFGRWKDEVVGPLEVAALRAWQESWLRGLQAPGTTRAPGAPGADESLPPSRLRERLGLGQGRLLTLLYRPTVGPLGIVPTPAEVVTQALSWARGHASESLVLCRVPGLSDVGPGIAGEQAGDDLRWAGLPADVSWPDNVRLVTTADGVHPASLLRASAAAAVFCLADAVAVTMAGVRTVAPLQGLDLVISTEEGLGAALDRALAAGPVKETELIAAYRLGYHALFREALDVSAQQGQILDLVVTGAAQAPAEPVSTPGMSRALAVLVEGRAPAGEPDGKTRRGDSAAWEAAAALGESASAVEARTLVDDLSLVLGAPGPLIGIGPQAALLRERITGQSWVQVDPRRPDLAGEQDIVGDLGGDPASLPIGERVAGAVASIGALGLTRDGAAEIRAYRRWLVPGGGALVVLPQESDELAGAGVRYTAAGLRELMTEGGFTAVVVRRDPVLGLVALGWAPARADGLTAGPGGPVLGATQSGGRLLNAAGEAVGVRRGAAWSCWPVDVDREQPVKSYYHCLRQDVQALVPQWARRVLDVGCAAGAMGGALKAARPGLRVDGIEVVPAAARLAARRLDRVVIGPVEQAVYALPDGAYDAVVLADVLEHTIEPEEVLRLLRPKLAVGGKLVVSLPNLRHGSVVRQLLEGRFDYVDAGILDRTHLRHFTRLTMLQLFARCGYTVEHMEPVQTGGEASSPLVAMLAKIGLAVEGLQEETGAYQYLLVCREGPVVPAITEDEAVLRSVQAALDLVRSGVEALEGGRPGEAPLAFWQASQHVALLCGSLTPEAVTAPIYDQFMRIYSFVLSRLSLAAAQGEPQLAREAEVTLASLADAVFQRPVQAGG